MASIIEGYNYDIFISYRQKDNKYDGWVTEFVEHLKSELESAFKDDVSVYFDINPHDGLLETHDVRESLKQKLKCLVFIPVLSRTYCDTRAFAWENEFKAFIEQATGDRFGLKIPLAGGNVASRIVPVRINDLDHPDIKLCETLLGGVLRGVDFVYKEAGVNRPLRSKEENPHDNLNHTFYRNQINKVALTLKDIIESMKQSAEAKSDKKDEKQKIAIETPVEKEFKKGLDDESSWNQQKNKSGIPKLNLLLFSGVVLLLLLASVWFLRHRSNVRIAYQNLSVIEQLAYDGNYKEAYDIAVSSEKYVSADSLSDLWPLFSTIVSTTSQPEGAKLFRKDYDSADTAWIYIGTTPLDSIHVPFSFSKLKIEKEGYITVYDVSSSIQMSHRNYILDKQGTIPENMVHVPGINLSTQLSGHPEVRTVKISDFLIDKFEVTNNEYKTFVDSGGYDKKIYWKFPFLKDGKEISWEEAMKVFIDESGRHGPANWEGSDFPEGQGFYPVSGLSWFEAAAYAEFAGKSLPTKYHWARAAGFDMMQHIPFVLSSPDREWAISYIIKASNINGHGPAAVGSFDGMTCYGTMDMVGNVREWCFNKISPNNHNYIVGGGWNDPTYLANSSYTQDPWDRSRINGFRCAKYLNEDNYLSMLMEPVKIPPSKNFTKIKPITEEQFEIYKRMFAYDKSPLDPKIESEKNESNWIRQKITYKSAYDSKDRIISYLFLPKASKPPYDIVIYFPGSAATHLLSSETLSISNLDFIIKEGRAVLYPVYKGTYERRYDPAEPATATSYREHVIQWYQDLARSVDYLETRDDINTDTIAYLGFSWGGRTGPLFSALDRRLSVLILYIAGLHSDEPYPEIDPFSYVPRVTVPVLILNGRYDSTFPYETSQKPLIDFMGTNISDKRMFVYPSGHSVPRNELIRETLSWLDKYMGPVDLN